VVWSTSIQTLHADNTSGAAEIARQAVEAMQQWLEQMGSADFAHWRAELIVFGRRLYAAQPAMAPLFHLVNDALLAIDSAATVAEAEGRVRHVAQTFLQQLDQAPARLLAAAWPLLAKAPRILTFSYSSSVLAVLRSAQAHHLPMQVFCTEGRPIMEGRRMAQRLAEAGIAVTFGIDAAVSAFAAQASLVLIGADGIACDGVVNKVGTTGVALAAQAAGVPCYVVAGRQKWLPAALSASAVGEPKPAEEVWPDPPAGVRLWNTYFECTPLDLFSGFIAEQGVLAPRELVMALSSMLLAPALHHWRDTAAPEGSMDVRQ
jgi:translation initiation factor 2B subunit (eIF-2B alpha/beta/delta family)